MTNHGKTKGNFEIVEWADIVYDTSLPMSLTFCTSIKESEELYDIWTESIIARKPLILGDMCIKKLCIDSHTGGINTTSNSIELSGYKITEHLTGTTATQSYWNTDTDKMMRDGRNYLVLVGNRNPVVVAYHQDGWRCSDYKKREPIAFHDIVDMEDKPIF